jgi:dTDP-D-glucose 4,6-dehydratase
LLNWTPKITHSEGFEKTMEWLLNQNFSQLKQK